jgi:serine/threonine kinase PknH
VEGTPFGHYRLIELLGRGGMGEVWRALDTATNNRTVAIKLLPPQLAADRGFVQRFRREADAAARLNNPHIIPIHTYGEIDGRLYVDMRLVEGRDLQQVLAGAPMDPARAVRIIEQVAKALHAAHKIGLVHRDVKPSNILLDEDDFAYLIDFGIAIARSENETRLTGTGIIGSWPYMSPERLSDGEVDARADVYALTCVLYECLTGGVPFPRSSTEQQITAHLIAPPPRPSSANPNVPAGFDAVIATGMAKDPDQRYATTVELANAAQEAITTPLAPASKATRISDAARPSLEASPGQDLDLIAPQQNSSGDPSAPQPRTADELTREPGPNPPRMLRWLRRPSGLITAAVVLVVLLGAIFVVPQLLRPSPTSSPTSAAKSAAPSGQTALPVPPPSGIVSSASAPGADVPGLAPLVGIWRDHMRTVVIRQNGSGHLVYPDLRSCPPGCVLADAPAGTVDFTLTSVSNDVATGSVDASSDENNVAVGAPVTAQIGAGSPSGQILQMSTGRLQQLLFCNDTSAGQCGA